MNWPDFKWVRKLWLSGPEQNLGNFAMNWNVTVRVYDMVLLSKVSDCCHTSESTWWLDTAHLGPSILVRRIRRWKLRVCSFVSDSAVRNASVNDACTAWRAVSVDAIEIWICKLNDKCLVSWEMTYTWMCTRGAGVVPSGIGSDAIDIVCGVMNIGCGPWWHVSLSMRCQYVIGVVCWRLSNECHGWALFCSEGNGHWLWPRIRPISMGESVLCNFFFVCFVLNDVWL
jgi:hypothetical protein